jgi:hypothetical protein
MKPITRREAIATVLTATVTSTAVLLNTRSQHKKVQWVKLTDEPLGPGDMWSSEDPNHPEKQGGSSGEDYNLQMQAVEVDEYATPSNRIGMNCGAHWRPIGLVDC